MRRGAFVLLGSMVAVLALVGPAFAHSETGILTVEARPPDAADPSAVTVRARLVYDNDLHPVPGVPVVATGTGPDGATLPETPLADVGEGEYESVITFPSPGAWNLTVTSTGPDAAATLAVDVAENPATTAAPSTSGPPATTGPSTDDGGDGGDDDSGVPVVPIVLGAIAVAGVTAAFVVFRRR